MLRSAVLITALVGADSFCSPLLHGGSQAGLLRATGMTLQGVSMSAVAGGAAKDKLLRLLGSAGLGKGETDEQVAEIDSLVEELSKEGTRFTRKNADGDWALVLSRNSKGSPKLQQASNSVESVGTSFANFDCSQDKFFNIAQVLQSTTLGFLSQFWFLSLDGCECLYSSSQVFGGKGTLKATVAFKEIEEVGIPLGRMSH